MAYPVWICFSLDREIRSLGGKCYTYTCDLTKRDAVYSTCERIKEEVGPVSILINNAGIVGGKNFLDLDDGNLIIIGQQ